MSVTETLMTHQELNQQEDNFLDYALARGFGELHFKIDPQTGMKAIVAIHSTKLGPALGGCRFISYPSTTAALYDAMRLARGMSYKAALIGLPLGGGKSVIIKPVHAYDRTQYLKTFGNFLNTLNGRYITALDSGTNLEDMDIIAQSTPYVASLSNQQGDPSPHTAQGVFQGIKAAVFFKLNKSNLKGLHIAIQGLGHVGMLLAQRLHDEGVSLSVSDINVEACEYAEKKFGATIVSPESIHKVVCDVFSPCALGAVINDITISQLNTSIIAGAANNQLAHFYHGARLKDLNILYAPDYVINAGGLVFAASKYLKMPESVNSEKINNIGDTLMNIFEKAQSENRPISEVADDLAQELIN